MLVRKDVKLVLVNTRFERIQDTGRVELNHHQLNSERYSTRKEIFLGNQIVFPANSIMPGLYSLRVTSEKHRTVSRFVTIQDNGILELALTLPIEPDKVSRVRFDTYDKLPPDLRLVLERSVSASGENRSARDYYVEMNDLSKAGLFNIYTKMKATILSNHQSTFEYVQSLIEVKPARFYAHVDSELHNLVTTKSGHLFERVDNTLHRKFDNHILDASVKTRDRYGNLQLTFSRHVEEQTFIVDADIDNSSGLAHLFDVIGHKFTGTDSHPYDIREILLGSQNLDPGYDLFF